MAITLTPEKRTVDINADKPVYQSVAPLDTKGLVAGIDYASERMDKIAQSEGRIDGADILNKQRQRKDLEFSDWDINTQHMTIPERLADLKARFERIDASPIRGFANKYSEDYYNMNNPGVNEGYYHAALESATKVLHEKVNQSVANSYSGNVLPAKNAPIMELPTLLNNSRVQAEGVGKPYMGEVLFAKTNKIHEDAFIESVLEAKLRSDDPIVIRDVVNNWKEIEKIIPKGKLGHFELLLKQAKENVTTTDAVSYLMDKYVTNNPNPYHEDGTEKDTMEKMGDALPEITSKEFIAQHGAEIQQKVLRDWSNNIAAMRNEYNIRADNVMGNLVQKINAGLKREQLANDPDFQKLNGKLKGAMSTFADQRARAVAALAISENQLSMQQRAFKKQEQQEEATKVYGNLLGKIVSGEITDSSQILSTLSDESKKSGDNAYILDLSKKLIPDLKAIVSSPDLAQGLKSINDAAKTGIFRQLDKDDPAGFANRLRTELRTKYLTDETFRGEKVDKWITEKTKGAVKKSTGAWMDMLKRNFQSETDLNTYPFNDQYGDNQRIKVGNDTYKTTPGIFKKLPPATLYKPGQLIVDDQTKEMWVNYSGKWVSARVDNQTKKILMNKDGKWIPYKK